MTLRAEETETTWTIAEAEARLSEILRLAESEGPQRIGSFIVVAEGDRVRPEGRVTELKDDTTLGEWLVENLRGLGPLYRPFELDSGKIIPFADYTEEELQRLEREEE